MKKVLLALAFLAALPALSAQSDGDSPKRYFFGTRASARLSSINVTDTTVWSSPRLGFSAGVVSRFYVSSQFFITTGYEFCRNTYYDNSGDRYIRETNNSLFLEFNLARESLSEKASPFVGIGTAIDFSGNRDITAPGGYTFMPDPELGKDDYFIPIHFVLGLQRIMEGNVREISIAISRNLSASNRLGAINTNSLVMKLQYSYVF